MPRGRAGFRQGITQRLLPALRAFNPSLILLSTGFDTVEHDVGNARYDKSGMNLTPDDIAWATSEVLKIADYCCHGRVVSVLEGGYGSYDKHSAHKHGNGGGGGSGTNKDNKESNIYQKQFNTTSSRHTRQSASASTSSNNNTTEIATSTVTSTNNNATKDATNNNNNTGIDPLNYTEITAVSIYSLYL